MSLKTNKDRKVQSIVSDADQAELERHYRFLPSASPKTSSSSSWQERMVQRYHQHLYKDYVLADLSRARQKQIGLRWRTHAEVQSGKGSSSCGNKHCPSHAHNATSMGQQEPTYDAVNRQALKIYSGRSDDNDETAVEPRTEQEEQTRLQKLPHGMLLADFEVPFTYTEDKESKTELVKLRLCARCAPLLFLSKGETTHPALSARRARTLATDDASAEDDEGTGMAGRDEESSSPSLKRHRNEERRRKKKRQRKRRREDDG